jgi:AmpD protein
LEGDVFEDAQYEQLSRLCLDLHRHYAIAHVAGHEHIAPGRKGDPGSGFDWQRLKATLQLPDHCFPVCF